jgi:hypothetical protein
MYGNTGSVCGMNIEKRISIEKQLYSTPSMVALLAWS